MWTSCDQRCVCEWLTLWPINVTSNTGLSQSDDGPNLHISITKHFVLLLFSTYTCIYNQVQVFWGFLKDKKYYSSQKTWMHRYSDFLGRICGYWQSNNDFLHPECFILLLLWLLITCIFNERIIWPNPSSIIYIKESLSRGCFHNHSCLP